MSDFTNLAKELRKRLDPTKRVQIIKLDNTEYMLGQTKSGYMVTTEFMGEECYVTTIRMARRVA